MQLSPQNMDLCKIQTTFFSFAGLRKRKWRRNSQTSENFPKSATESLGLTVINSGIKTATHKEMRALGCEVGKLSIRSSWTSQKTSLHQNHAIHCREEDVARTPTNLMYFFNTRCINLTKREKRVILGDEGCPIRNPAELGRNGLESQHQTNTQIKDNWKPWPRVPANGHRHQ